MQEQRACDILRYAISLHVLRPEDLEETQTLAGDDPVSKLISLQREEWIRPDAVEALGKLAKAHRKRLAGLSLRQRASGSQAAGSRSAGDTLAPERREDEQALLGVDPAAISGGSGGSRGGALVDDFLAAASFLQSMDASGTLAPERDLDPTSAGATESHPAGGTLAGDDGGTLAGDDGGTLAGDDGGTLAGSMDAAASHLSQTLGGELSETFDAGALALHRVIDMALVNERTQRTIKDAALARTTVHLGAERRRVREVQANAIKRQILFPEALLQSGLVDRARLREAQGLCRQPLSVCGICLSVWPEAHDPATACPSCGRIEEAAARTDGGSVGGSTGGGTNVGTAGSTSASGTLVSSTSASLSTGGVSTAKGIDGFPGEGRQFANYQLVTRIAEGGMGVVFKALEVNLNRIVALKVMRGGALASKVRRRRFVAEAEAAAALHHPHIVPIHQISEVSGYPFYTMDYVEGAPLDAWSAEERVEVRELVRIMRQVSDAVHHFHLRGIIHRDLKPDNVLVNEQHEPRIIDFGIAKKITSDFDTDASFTVEGEVLGTPHYMPPEQAGGRVHEVDTRSDVYALGAILYQLLTHKKPFEGLPLARVVLAIQDEDPRPVDSLAPHVDRDVIAIVDKAMAKERERRYQSALEFAQDLQRYLDNEPIKARPASLGYRAKKFVRRHRVGITVASVVAVALCVVAFALVRQATETQRKVSEFLARAQETEDLEERRRLLDAALGLDPDHDLAQAAHEQIELEFQRRDDLARAERDREEAVRLERERAKQRELEAQLERERTEQQLRQLEAAEQARRDAELAAQREREQRAIDLLAQLDDSDPLAAISALTDALALVPEQSGEVGAQLAQRKLALALQLGADALDNTQPGLAQFWIGQARNLAASEQRQAELDTLAERLRSFLSGEQVYREAQAALAQQDWPLAASRLYQARDRGFDAPQFQADLDLVEQRLREQGERRLEAARTALRDERPIEALREARLAEEDFPPSERAPILALQQQAAARAYRAARAEVHALWQRAETRLDALELLRSLAESLAGTEVAAQASAERAHRQRLLVDQELEGLVYLPAIPELGISPAYVSALEVTNLDYARFVEAGGYTDATLWDPEALPRLAEFHDATPGEAKQPGPRGWRAGGFGDPSNARRPLRGITAWEARAYARWRTRETGQPWRLLRAPEWEAIAGWDPAEGRLRTYPWGEDFRPEALTLDARLAPWVGSSALDRSPLGAFDVAGSVGEWVLSEDAVAVKGAFFSAAVEQARRLAQLRSTGRPGPTPPRELVLALGVRLALDVESP